MCELLSPLASRRVSGLASDAVLWGVHFLWVCFCLWVSEVELYLPSGWGFSSCDPALQATCGWRAARRNKLPM